MVTVDGNGNHSSDLLAEVQVSGPSGEMAPGGPQLEGVKLVVSLGTRIWGARSVEGFRVRLLPRRGICSNKHRLKWWEMNMSVWALSRSRQ